MSNDAIPIVALAVFAAVAIPAQWLLPEHWSYGHVKLTAFGAGCGAYCLTWITLGALR